MIRQIWKECSALEANKILRSRIFSRRQNTHCFFNQFGRCYRADTLTGTHTVALTAMAQGVFLFQAVSHRKRTIYFSDFMVFVIAELGHLDILLYVQFDQTKDQSSHLIKDPVRFARTYSAFGSDIYFKRCEQAAEHLTLMLGCTTLPYILVEQIRNEIVNSIF